MQKQRRLDVRAWITPRPPTATNWTTPAGPPYDRAKEARTAMFTMNPKRRRTLRRAVRVECEVVRARDRRLVGSRTLDLSIDGMLVPTDERVLTGEELLVSFRAPSSVRWLFCEATVARVVHGRRMEDFARCLGIVFEDLDLWSQLVLRDHLRGLPPPLPQRPLRAVLGAA